MTVIVRPATLDDVVAIHALISADARKGGLLPRSVENITAAINNFVVATFAGSSDSAAHAQSLAPIIGCGSLAPMSPNIVELRSLAVDKTQRGLGIGQKIVAYLIERARARNFGTIYALTRAVDFFLKCGFEIEPKENFPEKVWHDCVNCPLIAACDEVAVALDLDDRRWMAGDGKSSSNVSRQPSGVGTASAFVNLKDIDVYSDVKKVVLAFSGGLDTSCAVPWLREHFGCDVVCFVANVGQQDDLDVVRERALAGGASKVIVEDLRDEFATEYLFPLIQSGAIYEHKYMLGASIVRPLIAKRQVEIAEQEGADAVAHGSTGKGNDQVRFELAYMALDPDLKVIAPWREWNLKGRADALAYAKAHAIPISENADDIYSDDDNLWHMSHEGGRLEDPWLEPDERMWLLTRSPEQAPHEAEYVEIEFVAGMPKAINGNAMKPADLIRTLNLLGARHGVGRADLVENRLVGMKSHGAYETPGGAILRAAHQGLEELTLDRETHAFKQQVALRYADLVYNGKWFTPLRDALQAFVAVTQRDVTGVSRIKLYKGSATLVGRKANYSLYREDLATFMSDEVYDQTDADGFITLYGLPLRVKAQVDFNRVHRPAPVDWKKARGRD
jgi:argininosuccinate synthase